MRTALYVIGWFLFFIFYLLSKYFDLEDFPPTRSVWIGIVAMAIAGIALYLDWNKENKMNRGEEP